MNTNKTCRYCGTSFTANKQATKIFCNRYCKQAHNNELIRNKMWKSKKPKLIQDEWQKWSNHTKLVQKAVCSNPFGVISAQK